MRKSILPVAGIIGLLLVAGTAGAQSTVIGDMLAKLKGHRNLSYAYTYKQKDFTDDTLIRDIRDRLVKVPEDPSFGYFFTSQYKDQSMKGPELEIYNGHDLMSCNLYDSSYIVHRS